MVRLNGVLRFESSELPCFSPFPYSGSSCCHFVLLAAVDSLLEGDASPCLHLSVPMGQPPLVMLAPVEGPRVSSPSRTDLLTSIWQEHLAARTRAERSQRGEARLTAVERFGENRRNVS